MFLIRTYYQLKPLIPSRLRLAARRWRAERRRRRFVGEWPINPRAAAPPPGWKGWPDGKKFALVLTHDVERTEGLEKCRAIANLEIKYGMRSAFNFVPEGDYRVPDGFRDFLTTHGFEVGVHDLKHDGKLYWSRGAFRRQAQVINTYLRKWNAVGFRSGFMHHNLDWIHDLEVLYDSSTFDTDPFEPQPDGVNTIFPFWVPRPPRSPSARDSALRASRSALESPPPPLRTEEGYMELPYTLAQDFTLFLLLEEKSIDIWIHKLDWIAEHGGMAMIDVHPDYVDIAGAGQPGVTYPAEFYERFLEYVQRKYAGQYWLALPKEVAAYIRNGQKIDDAATKPAIAAAP
jgi:hypothetical protein